MMYAFDLDGTLIDSRKAVLQAYHDVGVTPPDDFFMKPWRDWLKDEEAHKAKNRRYLELIPMIRELPLMDLYRRLSSPLIMTGASRDAVKAIADHFGLASDRIISEMNIRGKIRIMNQSRAPGIMFEDQPDAAETMRKETKWTICHTI